MPPQDVLVNYRESCDSPLSPLAVRRIEDCLTDSAEHLIRVRCTSDHKLDFDLDGKILVLESVQPFVSASPESMVTAYASTRYHPSASKLIIVIGHTCKCVFAKAIEWQEVRLNEVVEGDGIKGDAKNGVAVRDT